MNPQTFTLPHNHMLQVMEEQNFEDLQNVHSFLTLQISNLSTNIFSTNQNERQFYARALLNFIKKIIQNISIQLQKDLENPIKQIFELVKKLAIDGVGYEIEGVIFQEGQAILQIFIHNTLQKNENQIPSIRFTKNSIHEVEYFRQMLKPIVQVLKFNHSKNIQNLSQVDFSLFTQNSQIIWLHFVSSLLQNQEENPHEANLIVKLISVGLKNHNIGSLHFFQTLLLKFSEYLEGDFPDCQTWKQIERTENISFEALLNLILDFNLRIFTIPDQVLLNSNIIFLKRVFSRIKKFKFFNLAFQKIRTLIQNFSSTVLTQQTYMEERKRLFNAISTIWLEDQQFSFTCLIHETISLPVSQSNDLQLFFWYLVDITGLLQPIQSSETFKNLGELIYIRLKDLLTRFLGTKELRNIGFGNFAVSKAFVDAVYELVNDEEYRLKYQIQTQLPIQLEELLSPYLIQLLDFPYPDKLLLVWIKFIKLNPLSTLLPLHSSMQGKHYYRHLLNQYFENLYKIVSLAQLTDLYQFVGDSIEKAEYWWEEVIVRQYKPAVNVNTIIKSCIGYTQRQKERCGKLLFAISKYDNEYWKVDQRKSEKEYVRWFVENLSFLIG